MLARFASKGSIFVPIWEHVKRLLSDVARIYRATVLMLQFCRSRPMSSCMANETRFKSWNKEIQLQADQHRLLLRVNE